MMGAVRMAGEKAYDTAGGACGAPFIGRRTEEGTGRKGPDHQGEGCPDRAAGRTDRATRRTDQTAGHTDRKHDPGTPACPQEDLRAIDRG